MRLTPIALAVRHVCMPTNPAHREPSRPGISWTEYFRSGGPRFASLPSPRADRGTYQV
jgi:hypothetical protein